MSNQPNVANCPKQYQRFSTSYTYCQPRNTSCHIKQRGVSDSESEQILELHNKYRSIISTQGQESNGLPPASNMMVMEWDKELAAIAQAQCDRCIYAHDESGEREVMNFRVGQNIAKQNSGAAPTQADWEEVIGKLWYGEIKNFRKRQICGSRENIPKAKAIGHFTQAIWADSFRVGCGYTMYKEGEQYIRLYSCNYGPGGNIETTCVYKEGSACSNCPENTACTSQGLCKRTNNEAPYYAITAPTVFNCNFRDPKSVDCKNHREGANSWGVYPALGGPFIETTLEPGQNTTIAFHKKIAPTNGAKKTCVRVTYRMGPALAKNPPKNKAIEIFTIPSRNGQTLFRDLSYNYKFGGSSMNLKWSDATELKISFAVPKGATPQFFDLQSVVGFNDECPK